MKPFDLEKALAGEPVMLRDGRKAFVKFEIPDEYDVYEYDRVAGFCLSKSCFAERLSWNKNGRFDQFSEDGADIVGMWQEPRPRVQLDLPAPLKDVQQGQRVYFLNLGDFISPLGSFVYNSDRSCDCELFKNGGLFATEENAQEWLDAMKGARR